MAASFATQLVEAVCPAPQDLSRNLTWYGYWVGGQAKAFRSSLATLMEGFDDRDENLWQADFFKLWSQVAEQMKVQTDLRIDGIVQLLIHSGTLKVDGEGENLSQARKRIFAIIGWQTMLWKVQASPSPSNKLLIYDEMQGFKGEHEICLQQEEASCGKPLEQLIMGFGILLPSVQATLRDPGDEIEPISEFSGSASWRSMNAYLLFTVAGVKFRWIDVLTHHLEYDKKERVLYLYRFPSFCLLNIPSATDDEAKTHNFSSIYACCGREQSGSKFWASRSDVKDLLRETILSYRFLFGQHPQSRQLYKRLVPFGSAFEAAQDSLLHELCGQKTCELTEMEERDDYDLRHDFPLYYSRLMRLRRLLTNSKARTWAQLWRDKRDSAQWLTFWLLLIFGGLGVIFGFLQVVLQIVQLGTISG